MSSLLKCMAIFFLLSVMAGCGANSYTKYTDISLYPYRYAAFDYKYAWNTTATDRGLLIEGAMKNVRYPMIESVLLTVNVIDKDGKSVASTTDFPMPQQTREGDTCFFSLLLKDVKPAPSDILQFQVHYTGSEGKFIGVDWRSSFKAEEMTGAVISPPVKKTDNW
jgi:hypothetical protein